MKEEKGNGRQIAEFARQCHGACLACRDRQDGGLGLRFHSEADDSVVATFECDPKYQSYPDRLHGGIVALLLDSAMTHCLFARQIHGVTARLSIRYLHPMELGIPATIRARVVRRLRGLIDLEAEIRQRDRVAARAESRFVRLSGPPAGKEQEIASTAPEGGR